MNLFADHCPGGFRRQHPYRNLQTPPALVNDGDRTISPLRSPNDLKGRTTEWVKTVEDVDVRGFCTQGTVGVGVLIPMCIAWSQVAGSPQIIDDGFPAGTSSFCPSKYSVLFFAESFSTLSSELLKNTSLLLPGNSLLFNPQQSSPLYYALPRIANGSFMPSDPLPAPRRS